MRLRPCVCIYILRLPNQILTTCQSHAMSERGRDSVSLVFLSEWCLNRIGIVNLCARVGFREPADCGREGGEEGRG